MIANLNNIFPAEVAKRVNADVLEDEDISKCWPWSGCCFSTGYGCVTVSGKNAGAHRVVWEMHNGRKIPEGLLVRHSCDNPSCCNPYHLNIGTVQDNSDDMVLRNRQAQCQKHGMAKLTNVQAKDIVDSKESYTVLSKKYGVSKTTIARLKTGRGWQGLALDNTNSVKPKYKLDTESARAVFLANGSQQEIAERFGIAQKQVSYIKSGRAWGKATADLRGK